MECLKGLFKNFLYACRRARRGEPRPDWKQLLEQDRQEINSTGLTFKMKLLAVHEISGDSLHHVSSSDFGEAAAEISTCKNLVNLTVAPTRIHITQDDPWKLLHDHEMETIVLFTAYAGDPRLFAYVVKHIDTITGKTTYKYLHLQTLRKEKRVTGDRVCAAFTYAQTYWEEEYPKSPHPRVEELRKRGPNYQVQNENQDGPNEIGVLDTVSVSEMQQFVQQLVGDAVARTTNKFLKEQGLVETSPVQHLTDAPLDEESVSQDTDMLTEEPSICVSCPERLDFANVRIPSLSDISVASI